VNSRADQDGLVPSRVCFSFIRRFPLGYCSITHGTTLRLLRAFIPVQITRDDSPHSVREDLQDPLNPESIIRPGKAAGIASRWLKITCLCPHAALAMDLFWLRIQLSTFSLTLLSKCRDKK
jgi:hypothetical protein